MKSVVLKENEISVAQKKLQEQNIIDKALRVMRLEVEHLKAQVTGVAVKKIKDKSVSNVVEHRLDAAKQTANRNVLKSVLTKEYEISVAQKRYRDIANHQYISNESKTARLGLGKKLALSDREVGALNQNVAVATGGYQTKVLHSYFQKIETIVSEQKRIEKATKAIRIEIEHLKSQIRRVATKRERLKERAVSDYEHREHIRQSRCVVVRLENRLHAVRQTENHIKHDNIRLQILIRNMCIERIQFNKLWVKIVNRVYMNKKMLIAMTDQAVIAFEKGVEFRKRMDIATKNATIIRNDQIDEMSAVMRSLRLDKINDTFFGNKMHRIKMRKLEANELKRRNDSKNYHSATRDAYKVTMSQVEYKSGESHVNSMIARFEKHKREYSSYFSYLNDLHGHVMHLNAILNQLEERVRESKTKSVLRKQKSNDKVVRWYGDALNQTKLQNCQKENELEELIGSLERYHRELSSLVGTLQCGGIFRRSLVKDFENDAVHLHNVEAFLSMMEQRLKQIIGFVYYLEWRESDYELPSSKVVQGVDVVNYHLNEEATMALVHECAECAMDAGTSGQETQVPLDVTTIRDELMTKATTPEIAYRMHNISQCDLPASRALFAKSLQN